MRMLRRPLVIVAISGTLAPMLQAQASPPRRAHHALVYHEARRLVLMTAGSTPLDGGQRFQFFNDLWALSDSGWTLLGESGDRMSGIGLAYDQGRQRVVSFGGYVGRGSVGDLRALSGNQWEPLERLAEMAVAEPGFTYDAGRNRLVAFGGSAGRGQAVGDTWEFDGTTWEKRDVAGPPARQAHAMVHDSKRRRTVVFGGMGSAEPGRPGPSLGDTWEYDGSRWIRMEASGPSPRQSAGAAFDSKRGVVILFGGSGETGFLGDTWSWDGARWQRLSESGPEPRAMGYLAYDKQRDRVVLFGGRKGWPDGDLNDTWEWDGTTWRKR
jgi:hypothetical protein